MAKENDNTLLLIGGAALVLFWPFTQAGNTTGAAVKTNLFSQLMAKINPNPTDKNIIPVNIPVNIIAAPVPQLVSSDILPAKQETVIKDQYYDYGSDNVLPQQNISGLGNFTED